MKQLQSDAERRRELKRLRLCGERDQLAHQRDRLRRELHGALAMAWLELAPGRALSGSEKAPRRGRRGLERGHHQSFAATMPRGVS
jgi:hypothetical protein